ncbi:MAG: ABC transporter ATP-binding protein [Chloroflexi bacterium]|nr:ABC transporter ATP-binding protein [Chloroflexota bacterium]
MSGAAVEAIGLVKRFGSLVAVDGVDLALDGGRIYGLLGPNGSGKTTLIRMLAGLTRPTAGQALVLGDRMPSRRAYGRIGYMTQSDGLYPELSAWENLRFFGELCGVTERADFTRALDLVHLGDRAATPAYQLSGGMRRRLSLACALVHRPDILFLDEPTVGIDPTLRVEFWEHFRALAAGGATLLVSSHVMDEATRCDELVLLLAGTVIERGSADEIRARAGTSDLEGAFLRVARDGVARDPAAGMPTGGAAAGAGGEAPG